MKAVVLAGGFARRMWPLTKDTPKPLLPVCGRPIIDYVLGSLSCVSAIDKVYISVNRKFEGHFRGWLSAAPSMKDTEIFAEESMREEEKRGAIGALSMLIKEKAIDDDLLVIAGDNLFDFDVSRFISSHNGTPVVALYDVCDVQKAAGKYGVVTLGDGMVIKEFHEKPANPPSSLISTGCYFFPKSSLHMIHKYLEEGQNPDAPGFFISWLSKKTPVHGFVFDSGSKWFDIGSQESYEDASRAFGKGP
ncbi:MAG: nucleotidyltransferase family protein [Candidatus Aenigmatarchaeota archaeon]